MDQKYVKKYAKLLVETGINLQKKEGLLINAHSDTLDLARECARVAYQLGAKDVILQVMDYEMDRAKYLYGADEIFDMYPDFKVEFLRSLYEENYHHLFIVSPNPTIFSDINDDLIARSTKVASNKNSEVLTYRMTGKTRWTIGAYPNIEWAKSVFPNESPEDALQNLTQYVMDATRVSEEDPISAWKIHDEKLRQNKEYLNEQKFSKLHITSEKTDLVVGLADQHFWMGGSKISQQDVSYFANIPTEEVFTTPHRNRVDGVAHSSKPLNLNGKLIKEFGFRFKDGKVIECWAEEGEEALKKLLETDDNASRLGEVALVPYDSPISNTGILFLNTLFDENAAIHLALGRAYSYAMENGSNLSQEELTSRGANFSLIHVDFMIGTKDTKIVATRANGEEVLLFKDGNWAI